jgi:ABC-2 type transport system permease protein
MSAHSRPGPLTGLGPLVRLVLRRGRWFYLAWVLALAGTVPAVAAAYETVVDPRNADVLIAAMTGNPTMRAMLGPPFELSTAGGFTVWRVGTFVATMAGMMAVLGVVRSTRADEEDGRTELLRSGSLGRHVPLVAAVLVALAACVTLGLLVVVGMVGTGQPVAGSVAFGLGSALVGAVFVGVGAVAAQLTGSARAARSIGLWTLAAAYTLRAVADGSAGDSAVRPLAWASPVQWMALTRPYAQERWWVLVIPALGALLLLIVAVVLQERRDHGAGLWASRPGRTEAPRSLGSPLGLSWRLHRGGVLGWTLGLVLLAVALGSLSTSFEAMFEETPALRAVLERMSGGTTVLAEAFFVAMLSLVAVVTGVLAVSIFQRLAAEEDTGRAELVLSTPTGRLRLLASHLLPAAVVPVALLVLTGAVLSLHLARTEGDWSWVGRIAGAGAALAPGGLVVLGLAVLLHGWAPRMSWLVWVVVGWSLLMVWVGAILDLPEWVTGLTPWAPLPLLPTDAMDWPAVLGTTAVAVVLTLAGAVGYRRRDVIGA